MRRAKVDYKAHVFVCTHQRKSGECCADSGGETLKKELKEWTKKHPEWRKRIRVNSSGCLDQCKHGVAIAVYPQNEWLLDVRPKNLDEVKDLIEKIMSDEPPSKSK